MLSIVALTFSCEIHLIACFCWPTHLIQASQISNCELVLISVIVYYRDTALRVNLPPRQQFSKATLSPLVSRLVEAAVTILGHEQSRMSSGGRDQAMTLARQLAGRSLLTSCYTDEVIL